MNPSDNLSAIEKATEGVTPGPWHAAPGTTTGRIVVSPNTTKAKRRVAAIGGPDRDANAAYIAACSPDRMREVLALARKAEAMEREIAEKDARIAALEAGMLPFARIADMEERVSPCSSVMVNVDRCRDARTLLNGGSDAE